MYTLTYGIVSQMLKKEDFFVVIVGLDNAGKTTFLEQTKMKFTHGYKMMNPAKITSTVGMNIGKIEYRNIRLNFWDLGGQEGLHSLWDKYFPDSNALIFVIDSSDEERFKEAHAAFERVMSNEYVQQIPVLVVCNKSDLEVDIDDGTTSGVDDLRRLFSADPRHHGEMAVMSVSSLDGLNVDRCIRWLVNSLLNAPEPLARNHTAPGTLSGAEIGNV
ncbi:hypothetical protein QR680_009140 [Steinernema hermaphroditum]|uniref:ADP-ribosylation factor-related protein 1 n=1 Tax=Steinernema hermaphroditum TaxID=289476 RepID=A0AA39M9C6_9BILA|nr:hypothetical protein QR680_009140 [Steinernema hermaphroditum]